MLDRGGLRSRVVAQQRLDQRLALATDPPQHGVDEPRGVRCPRPLDQLDRLIDRGVVGGSVGEEQLVDAEAQPGQHRRVDLTQRPVDEPVERGVDRAAALHGAIAEPLRLGSLATLELGGVGRLTKGQLSVRFALEGGADRLERELTGGSDHSLGREWPRR